MRLMIILINKYCWWRRIRGHQFSEANSVHEWQYSTNLRRVSSKNRQYLHQSRSYNAQYLINGRLLFPRVLQ